MVQQTRKTKEGRIFLCTIKAVEKGKQSCVSGVCVWLVGVLCEVWFNIISFQFGKWKKRNFR